MKKTLTPDDLKIIYKLDYEIFYGFILINLSLFSLAMYSWLI